MAKRTELLLGGCIGPPSVHPDEMVPGHMPREEVVHLLQDVGTRANEAVNDHLRLPPQRVIRIVPLVGDRQRRSTQMWMVSKVIGHEGMPVGEIAHLVGRRRIDRYERLNRLWDAGSRVPGNDRLEVVFPDGPPATIAIGCPVACVVPKMDDRYPVVGDGPGDICNHLLNKREEADIPLGNNVEPHRSSAQKLAKAASQTSPASRSSGRWA